MAPFVTPVTLTFLLLLQHFCGLMASQANSNLCSNCSGFTSGPCQRPNGRCTEYNNRGKCPGNSNPCNPSSLAAILARLDAVEAKLTCIEDSTFALNEGDLVQTDCNGESRNLGPVVGPQGLQGEPGPQGLQGEPGVPGSAGQDGVCTCNDPKIVFVTDLITQGNIFEMGGVDGANALCQRSADDAGLSGDYKAWLSTSSENAPIKTFTQSTTPYVLTDGTVIAEDWADLTDGDIPNWKYLDEDGNELSAQTTIWSSTNPDGTYISGDDCNGYTSISSSVRGTVLRVPSGGSTPSNPLLPSTSTRTCNRQSSVLCFEQ